MDSIFPFVKHWWPNPNRDQTIKICYSLRSSGPIN